MSIDHYENFPVASVLCPPALRPPIRAIYRFARTADDLADEGTALAAERQTALTAYRRELHAVAEGQRPSARWQPVFGPLQSVLRSHALPLHLLEDLLSAFEQDVVKSDYADRAELLDYCRLSANPVGRLLLHLYGINDPLLLQQSDHICSALQLINFWQDLSIDLPRGRIYLPASDRTKHGVSDAQLAGARENAHSQALVADLVQWARVLMQSGQPLVHALPGRAGLELRFVVQGGLRILDKIEALGHRTLRQRPTLGWADGPRLLWRAVCMRPPRSTAALRKAGHDS